MVSENEEIEYINTFYKHLAVYTINTYIHQHHQSRYNEFGKKDTLNFIYEGGKNLCLYVCLYRIHLIKMNIQYIFVALG